MLFLLRFLSALLARMPEWLNQALAVVVAELVFWCLPRRRRSVLSNLSHAFPEKPHRWLVRMGRRCFRRLMETGLLAVVIPNLSPSRLRRMAALPDASRRALAGMAPSGRGTVLAIPHLGAWELSALVPSLYDGPLPEAGAAYRPLRNRPLDDWIKQARERFGVRMLSRKEGFNEGMQLLRRGGIFGILFDQNAGDSGTLSLFLDRVCSTTHLVGLLVEKFGANLATFCPRRRAFWRYELEIRLEPAHPRESGGVIAHLNRWLEELLRADEDLSATWLWVHNRWKTQLEPSARFRLGHKRSILPAPEKLPRRTRFFVRLPDDPARAREVLPFLAALRQSRPDAALTAIVPHRAADDLASPLFDDVVPLPAAMIRRLLAARRLRRRYPDCWLHLQVNDSGLEARLASCPQRFGLHHPGRRQRWLTHGCETPAPAREQAGGLDAWRADLAAFFRRFGLPEDGVREAGEAAAAARGDCYCPGAVPGQVDRLRMPLLSVEGLRTSFHTRNGVVRAVSDVSFSLQKGETLGIVGESGSGKSVTCYSIMGLIPQPPGRIEGGRAMFDGVDLLCCSARTARELRGKRIAMIFQDPMTSLNPYLRVSEQIIEPLLIHGMCDRRRALVRAVEALDEVGIQDAARRVHFYPHEFSGGMRQRVMIAMALITRPELLIADEPTTALDVTVQAQILELIKRLQRELGMAVIFITHDLGVVAGLCDRVQVMYAGRIVETASTHAVYKTPRHPYTRALQRSIPALQKKGESLFTISGLPPDLSKTGRGCPFAPRCPEVAGRCHETPVSLQEVAPSHLSACLRVQDGDLPW